MLRERLATALREAPDADTAATLRLVLAALKERDHCARESGAAEELDDGAIETMLQDMVAQRQDEMPNLQFTAIRAIRPHRRSRAGFDFQHGNIVALIQSDNFCG